MIRRLVLGMLLAGGTVGLAQDTDNLRPGLKEGFKIPPTENKTTEGGKPFPTAAAIVAAVSTVVILLILCTPSRRQ